VKEEIFTGRIGAHQGCARVMKDHYPLWGGGKGVHQGNIKKQETLAQPPANGRPKLERQESFGTPWVWTLDTCTEDQVALSRHKKRTNQPARASLMELREGCANEKAKDTEKKDLEFRN